MSAINKIKNFNSTAKMLQKVFWIKHLPFEFFQLAILGVIILLLVAPCVMLYSLYDRKYKMYGKLSCYGLIAFTILATLLFHFPTDPSERISFMKNLSIIGGFIGISLHY